MFKTKTYHICSVSDSASDSHLPVISPFASRWVKLKRFLKQFILVTEVNPVSAIFYRRTTRIDEERKAQISTNSWIVHPFSIFRLYYEMYLVLLFLFCLVYMPLYASYHFLLGDDFLYIYNSLSGLCLADVAINFVCGRCISQEKIVMKPKDIAKAYIFGPYFICDVLSSLPHGIVPHRYGAIHEFVGYLALLKVIRLITFLQYLERTLNYFQVKGFTLLALKIGLVTFLICHYIACAINFAIEAYTLVGGYTEKHANMNMGHRHNLGDFFRIYSRFMLFGASFFLDVELPINFEYLPVVHFTAIISYIMGKVIVSFFIVIFMDVFKITNYLEVKYQEVLSQVNSYMSAHELPDITQDKVRKFYHNKYHGKYLNEASVEGLISEKLKKEIKYHECRKLIGSVAIFKELPQEIMENILTHLKKEIYMPGDTLIKAGTTGECMYFMASGTVAVVSPSGKEICHLEDGDYFGEVCLFAKHVKRTANVIAVESCEVYSLERKYFKKCFEGHPEVLQEIQTEGKRRRAETKEIERQVMKSFAATEDKSAK